MLRLFFYLLLALAIGGLLGTWLGDDPGYVLISFNGYALETSFVALFIMLMSGFALFYVLAWSINRLNPWRIARVRGGLFLSRKQAATGTEEGLVQLVEQRYRDAYKSLVENAKRSPVPLVNYLAAAEAAFELNDVKGVRFCLNEAGKSQADTDVAKGLLNARLEEKERRFEDAIAQLQALQLKFPKHAGVLRLLSSLYVRLGAWPELVALLPTIKARQVFPDFEYQALEKQTYREYLQQFNFAKGRLPELQSIWDNTPKQLQSDEVILGTYVHHLVALGAYDRAQGVLFRYFKSHWSDSLIRMMGYLDTTEPEKLLVFLEKLLHNKPGSALLSLTLGRVSMRQRLWGKGREYFESALRLSTESRLTAEINGELARLYEHLGEHKKSMDCYHRAMGMLEQPLPRLPMPKPVSATRVESAAG